MARRTKQEAEETRESILDTALDVIDEKGYARSTFVEIAKRIDLSKGAVYWHFKDKPDLFLALGRQMEERIQNMLEDVFRGSSTSFFRDRETESPASVGVSRTLLENAKEGCSNEPGSLEGLKRMLLEMILLIIKDRRLRKYYRIVFYRMEWIDELQPIKRFFDRQETQMVQWFADNLCCARLQGEIPEESDIDHLSRALSALVDGLLAYCLSGPEDRRERATQIIQTGLDTFFVGLKIGRG